MTPSVPVALRAIINYNHGGPLDEEYNSKRKRQRLLRVALVRERVSSIRPGLASESAHLIDGTIFFSLIDLIRILQPHRDALILSLRIGDFDMRQILVDSSSSTDLLQVLVIKQMGFVPSSLDNLPWRRCATSPSRPSHPQCAVLSGGRFIPLQRHFEAHLVALHEDYPFHVPSDGEFPHRRRTDRSIR